MNEYDITSGGMITDESGEIIQLPWMIVFSPSPIVPKSLWDTLFEQGFIKKDGTVTDKYRETVREQLDFMHEHWDEVFKK